MKKAFYEAPQVGVMEMAETESLLLCASALASGSDFECGDCEASPTGKCEMHGYEGPGLWDPFADFH